VEVKDRGNFSFWTLRDKSAPPPPTVPVFSLTLFPASHSPREPEGDVRVAALLPLALGDFQLFQPSSL